jgi:hypothetical protein
VARDPHDYDNPNGKIKPDLEDYEAMECEYGRLPRNATDREVAERHQLAQSHKLIRLYRGQG